MEPVLRRATPADADAITSLVADAYRDYTPLIGRTPMPMLDDYARVVADHPVWVLEDADGLAGVIVLQERPDRLWVDNVAIAPRRQGRGLGRRLLRHAEDAARALGRDRIGLLTNERYLDNIAMYQRYGYRETHREPHLGTDLVYFEKRLDADG